MVFALAPNPALAADAGVTVQPNMQESASAAPIPAGRSA